MTWRGIFVTALTILLTLAGAWSPALHAQSEMVIQREGTTLYHRPGCDQVRDVRGVLAMTRAQAEARGLKAHAECESLKGSTEKEGAESPAKPAMVLIDVGGTYYHRDKCEKLSKNVRRVPVTEAYKKHWPCRTCKPPIRPRPGQAPFQSDTRLSS